MNKATFIAITFLTLGSCSKQYHERKFYQKGGTFTCVPEVIQRTDTIKGVDGKDSLIYCYDTLFKPEIQYVPKWKKRIEYRRFKDSLQHERVIYRDSIRTVVKTAKIESKQTTGDKLKRLFTWLIVGIVIGFAIRRYARF